MIVQLCNQTLAAQLSPTMRKKAQRLLFNLTSMANQFLNKINLKYGNLTGSEAALLEDLEPKIKQYLDSVQSVNQLTQSNKKPLVILGDQDEEPIVCGKKLKRLTIPGYNVIKVLYDAEGPITKDELENRSNHIDAVGILKRLSQTPEWKKVIRMAGAPGRGYSIKR